MYSSSITSTGTYSVYHINTCIECIVQLAYLFFDKGGCLVSSLSAAHARLHWAKIYIVAVM